MNSKQPFSESEVCDSPVSLYAATKRSNELMASVYNHLYGIESVGLRFFTVYGPWGRPDMAPFLFTKAAIEGKAIQVFNNGNQSRDFTYIDDIINGVLQIWKQPEKIQMAEICNIGNGAPVGLMDFIEAIEEATGESLEKDFKPAQLGDVDKTFADIEKLQRIFNYKPQISLNKGVPAFVSWYKEYYNTNSGMDE
jgi:UDP-glucuronate 4-epimerase